MWDKVSGERDAVRTFILTTEERKFCEALKRWAE